MSLTRIFLGLGSNIERERHLAAGLDALAGFLTDLSCSPVFESHAVGIKSGPFINLVVSALTDLPLIELDRRLKFIEADNGRYAPDRVGLPLDIDVLLYGDLVGNFDGLILPRAEILKNAFVLWPLSLIAPERVHPGTGQSFVELWAGAQIDQQLWPVAFEWRGQALTPPELLETALSHGKHGASQEPL
ncbi:2-amino-4-hydroxy-6-hydroxymethyldihydropteridine diphosphokinase [Pseudomonas sp. 21LCFQ010]|uniref:2-amino-4-hydroxy-6- hydroxymethyldihydropteridine diphosphokinase n=1 Tax=Pseudomonas sp. 21LCFQ010 TaxID=2957506 RepID=UPI002096ABFC|nr:2-amino-4-hydroxy-6-hydroxymethyldihydropteridine diphosphokinase [Pseudomonas sp. 21LCFQ010]MCO8164642.1 2-amino-4-hydroxy-6-hydroxymethyldihydropteridine diphosphokinase [Pseudomonas sp. 21LCFQ010]